MKTFTNPKELNCDIREFVYEGCRYAGIPVGLTFSVLSGGLADYLTSTFTWLVEAEKPAPIAVNEFCCSKCGRDCKSSFMKARHEKVCKETPKGAATILKPSYIFWNYKGLDKSQLTEDQLIPESVNTQPKPEFTEKEITEPMPGREGMAMIGKHLEKVVTDRDGVDWYGNGIENDSV